MPSSVRSLILCVVWLVAAQPVAFAERAGAPMRDDADASITQLIVKYKPAVASLTERERAARWSEHAGMVLTHQRHLMAQTAVIRLPRPMGQDDAQRVASAVAADPSVEWAVVDRRYTIQQTLPSGFPNDTYFPVGAPNLTPNSGNSASASVPNGQWYLRTDQPASINAVGAWAITTGSTGIVGAVLDTGVLFNHPDLGCVQGAPNCASTSVGGPLLAGYDFVSDPVIANDGDGRDADPADPGDWVTTTDVANDPSHFSNKCLIKDPSTGNYVDSPSSWHGSLVAAIIGARTNNGTGVAGVVPQARLSPVRVLGKCGGSSSDIIDAMLWAAGVSSTPVANPAPARVINLSLGGSGACSQAEQAAVDAVRAAGVVVVAAAGNASAGDASSYTVTAPANCNGVIAVGGLRQEGDKAGYSALGSEVKISAPAGNCGRGATNGTCYYGIIGASNTGTQQPATQAYSNEVGTSFSAPLVAGTAMLMLSAHPNLRPDTVLTRLQATANAFPKSVPTDPTVAVCDASNPTTHSGECLCTTTTCGAGMLNAAGAVQAALRPQALIAGAGNLSPGQSLKLSAAASTASTGRTIVGYKWELVSAPGGTTLSSSTAADTTITLTNAGAANVRLTVTDSAGDTDVATASVTAIATGGGGGGGGGAIGVAGLVLLVGAWLGARRNRALRGWR